MGLKELIEKKNAKIEEMSAILSKMETETRTEMTEEEKTSFDGLEAEIRALEESIARVEKVRDIVKSTPIVESKAEERAIAEERVFEEYVRGVVSEKRADVNLTVGDNGAVIPTSIANKIIKQVVDTCPIYQMATRYNVGGTLQIPYYDESTQAITMAYATEFVDLESKSGKFTNIELKGFLAGALSKISKSLVNNSQFAIVPFIITAMAETISIWIEKELLKGTTDKVAGLTGVTQLITAASATAITSDEIIRLKDKIKDVYQQNAIFIMNSATRTALRLLKDTTGKYILNDDVSSTFGTTLLGKPIFVTDNMDGMEAGKVAIYYGDMSGLAVKVSEDVSIEVLREKYATQHAIGVVAWVEMDAKVENAQKIAKLVMKAS